MKNLYTIQSKISRTKMSEKLSNLQTITADDASLVRQNICAGLTNIKGNNSPWLIR